MNSKVFSNQEELISIIVPVYNVERYVGRSVESIQNQTYTNLEILLIDDGSTDSSPVICDELASQDSRIRVIHKTNQGVSAARNTGLDLAKGQFIGCVDSDDWIEPDMYEKMLSACKEHQASLAMCRYAEHVGNQVIKQETGKVSVLDKNQTIYAYLSNDQDTLVINAVWSKLFSRELVEQIRFDDGRVSEDIMFTTKLLCNTNKAVYVDKCLYHYVTDRVGSIMNSKRTNRVIQDEIPFWEEQIAYLNEHASEELSKESAYFFYDRLLQYYVDLIGQKKEKELAVYIKKYMQRKKKEIRKINKLYYHEKSKKIRMQCFLFSPAFYIFINNLYLGTVVRMREKGN